MEKLSQDNSTFAFGRHETFPLRYGWFTKGVAAVHRDAMIFNKTELAMETLGLGKNMVNALKYWMNVAGIASFDESGAHITHLGDIIMGKPGDYRKGGDPYLEDEATLWLLHWLIASNGSLASGFFWFFNYYSTPRFKDQDAVTALHDFTLHKLSIKRSVSTLKSDISTLLRMYSHSSGKAGEEHLDSPFASLQLVHVEQGLGHSAMRIARPFLPMVVLHYAIQDMAEVRQLDAIAMHELLYDAGGWPVLGAIFRLNEDGLMMLLEQLVNEFNGYYELRDTAGLNQLYINKKIHAQDILSHYYQNYTTSDNSDNLEGAA